jgi:hypothetical protein
MRLTRTLVGVGLMIIISAIAAIILMSGCASTQLVNVWKDPAYQAAPLKKIMVIAMRKDQLRRRMWEDNFVSALKEDKVGTIAIPSYQLFPNDIPDTLAIAEKTQKEGFDGVLVVSRVERSQIKTDVPGYVAEEPVTVYRRRWGTYATRWETVYHPGYTDVQKVFSVRTDLLLPAEDGRLVWSATSKDINPGSPQQFRNAVSDLVMDKLAKEGLIR